MRMFIMLATFVMVFAMPARGDDASAAKSIIQSQADAFGRDDGAAAFSYAAPGIQGAFSQVDIFMSMVRQNYAPVYRHKSFEFGDTRSFDGKVAQEVHIVDADGELWEALYTLEQQPDGSMKISGCVLVKAQGRAV